GWLVERRNMGMVLADTLYWLILGMPLLYFFYHIFMHAPDSNTHMIMTKQAVNGIANALIARLIFTSFLLWSRAWLMPYREIIYNLLAFFVLMPALLLLAVGSRDDFADTDHHVCSTLIQESQSLTNHLETWVENRRSTIVHLAEMAASRPPEEMQAPLEQAQKSDINLLRIGLLDRQATTLAYAPRRDETGQTNIGRSFADRPYTLLLKQGRRPRLSEVMMGRMGTPRPVVAMMAPVLMDGEYGGFIGAILALEQIRLHLDKSTDAHAALYTLLDKNGNIIMTNRRDQTIMTPLKRGKGELHRLDDGLSQWVPRLPPQTAAAEQWQHSSYLIESTIGTLAEWQLIMEQPVVPFQKRLYHNYSGKLTLLFVILLGALALAELLSRWIVATLERLQQLTHDLPIRLRNQGNHIAWPHSSIKEAHYLINNFRTMGDSLSKQFHEIQEINKSLEQRVQERTRELAESQEKFRTVVDYSYGWEVWEDPAGICLYCSPSSARVTGYPPAALQADPGLRERLIHPDDLPRWKAHYEAVHARPGETDAGPGAGNEFDFRIIRADGEIRWISHLCHHIYDAKGHDLGHRISNRDITDRKLLETELVKARNLESLGILAGGIAHDFNNLLQGLLGNLEIAKMKSEKASPAYRFLEQAEQVSGAAIQLTRQLIAFSAGGYSQPTIIQPAPHIREESLATLADSGLAAEFDLPATLWDIKIDPSQFDNVIKQMVLNAMEALPALAENRLRITAANLSLTRNQATPFTLAPGNYLKISIQDQGSGIPKEHLPRIFDPYFSTKERGSQKGMGLGLALCDAIIRKQGGTITVESAPHQGTTFHIYIP
ncbi:MAG: ATP-binding protein, partial [Deltaproteobacteria bacterium]|nr:ATP-binding protein [Deltaproteobacteria bacterium]